MINLWINKMNKEFFITLSFNSDNYKLTNQVNNKAIMKLFNINKNNAQKLINELIYFLGYIQREDLCFSYSDKLSLVKSNGYLISPYLLFCLKNRYGLMLDKSNMIDFYSLLIDLLLTENLIEED